MEKSFFCQKRILFFNIFYLKTGILISTVLQHLNIFHIVIFLNFAIAFMDAWASACSWWNNTFSSPYTDVTSWFYCLNDPIMLHNALLWLFFSSQHIRWILCHVYPKKFRPRPIQVNFVSLGNFRPVPNTRVTAYWTQVGSDGSWIHVSATVTNHI